MPDCTSAEINPSALRSTVFPPVFGPETRSVRSCADIARSNGTTSAPCASSSGCRPLLIANPSRAGTSVAGEQAYVIANRARAYSPSSTTSASSVAMISSRRGRSSSVSSRRMRSTSSTSSDSSSRIRFPNSTAAGGSTNSVAPDADESWTMPPAMARPSRRTGITKRPLRIVTELSATRWCGSSRSISRSRIRINSACALRSSRRMRRSAADASSLTVPSSRIAFSIRASSAGATMRTFNRGDSSARTIGGRRTSPSDDCVRRDDRRSVAAAINSAPFHRLPMTRSLASASVRSGIGSGRHGSFSSSAARIAETRACSRSRCATSALGTSARTLAAPRFDDAKPATTSRTRGNSRTDNACEFTMPRNGKTRSRDGSRRSGLSSTEGPPSRSLR